jgi:hypothetical protein
LRTIRPSPATTPATPDRRVVDRRTTRDVAATVETEHDDTADVASTPTG